MSKMSAPVSETAPGLSRDIRLAAICANRRHAQWHRSWISAIPMRDAPESVDAALIVDAAGLGQFSTPVPSTLLNLASCRERNGQLATAWGLFLDAERATREATDGANKNSWIRSVRSSEAPRGSGFGCKGEQHRSADSKPLRPISLASISTARRRIVALSSIGRLPSS